jgi:chemotaxis protein MotB
VGRKQLGFITKRAVIVNIFLSANAKVKENLTAAGRGEFAPFYPNDTAEGKAARRIVILTPKLDELSKLLNEL